MAYWGINQQNVKINNRSMVLKLLNDCGAMSRKDIAEKLGLTPATVTMICSELLTLGVLMEEGELQEEKRAGRKKISVAINYERYYILCINLEADETTLTICDMQGKNSSNRTLKTDDTVSAEEFLANVADESKVLMWEQNISKEDVLGVGVTMPGIVDKSKGSSEWAYHFWGTPVDIVACLHRYLDFPIVLENNVKAFAKAELTYGIGKNLENLMFVKWGPGVGSALIIGKEIYEGHNSKAAEVGHMTVTKEGKQCRCGRHGCLETIVSTFAMAEQVRELCNETTTPELYNLVKGDASKIRASRISKWITVQDPAIWEMIRANIDHMARMLSNVFTTFAPDKVIIYGEVFRLPHFKEYFIEACKAYDPLYDEKYIISSDLDRQIRYIGPLAIVVNELFFGNTNLEAAK